MGTRRILRIPTPPSVAYPIDAADTGFWSEARVIAAIMARTDSATQSESAFVSTVSRDDLVYETYYPDATNTGDYGLASLTTTITTNQTYSTAGQTIQNTLFDGCRVSVTAANITFINCRFTGTNDVNALVNCGNVNATNVVFIDCTWLPKFLPAGSGGNTQNSISGHDYKMYRCDLSRSVDLLNITNTTLYSNVGAGWSNGVELWGCYLHGLRRITASSGGIVHPTDTTTHNDLIQQFGGVGTKVRGCTMDARFELQYSHMFIKSSGGVVYTQAQAEALPDSGPWIPVALGSLPDGGPFVAQYVGNGTGLRSRGELNSTDLAGLMMNSQQGYSANFDFKNNLCIGGEFFTNGGGNPYPGGGQYLGDFWSNAFWRDQGNQGSGVGNGHTIDTGGTWSGHYSAPTTGPNRNFYVDTVSGSDTITVR